MSASQMPTSNKHLDKTWQEIYNAVCDGKDVSAIYISYSAEGDAIEFQLNKYGVVSVLDGGTNYAEHNLPVRYMVVLLSSGFSEQPYYGCSSPDDYPALISGSGDSGSDDEPRM